VYKVNGSRTISSVNIKNQKNKENNMRSLYKADYKRGRKNHVERTQISDITNQFQKDEDDLSNYIDKPLNLALDDQKYSYDKKLHQSLSSLSDLDIESQSSDHFHDKSEPLQMYGNYGRSYLDYILGSRNHISKMGRTSPTVIKVEDLTNEIRNQNSVMMHSNKPSMTFGKNALETHTFENENNLSNAYAKQRHITTEDSELAPNSIKSNFNSTRNTKGLIREIEGLDEEILVSFQNVHIAIVPTEKLNGSISIYKQWVIRNS
jgi:hypothetical protein